MKKRIFSLTTLCTSLASAIGMSSPTQAQLSGNYVGPALSIGGGQTSIGIDSKFGVSDNFSLRPYVFFPSGSTSVGAALTYDFDTRRDYYSRVRISPYLGGGADISSFRTGSSVTTAYFAAGADFGFSDNLSLKAEVDIPVTTDRGQTTSVILGAGFHF